MVHDQVVHPEAVRIEEAVAAAIAMAVPTPALGSVELGTVRMVRGRAGKVYVGPAAPGARRHQHRALVSKRAEVPLQEMSRLRGSAEGWMAEGSRLR